MNLTLEAIKSRRSVRSYSGEALSAGEAEALQAAMDEARPGPFGGHPRMKLVSTEAAGLGSDGEGGTRIGTYGFIKGAPAFILGAVEKGAFAMEDFGYCLEGVMLRATELGLGTCWLGGALKRGQVGEVLSLSENEVIPCITPVGKAAERRSMIDRLVRSSARGDNRKPPETLFFDEAADRPLVLGKDDPWLVVLEALRLAPSASNKQPWRIFRTGGSASPAFHLFLAEDKAYNSALGEVKMQNVDMGIGMRHVEAAARALGLSGSWQRLEREPLRPASGLLYIASWIA